MSSAKVVAFAFTRPSAVVLIGKNWVDAEGRRYRMHVYPNKAGKFEFSSDRPNVVLVTRPDKLWDLSKHSSNIHRIILLGPPEEVLPYKIPLLDAVVDEKGRYMSAPRAGVDWFNKKLEEDAVDVDLSPPKQASKTVGDKSKRKVPKSLSKFLDAIEASLDDGDIWSDMERPVLDYFLGRISQKRFERACKKLVRLGVEKWLARAYYTWVVHRDEAAALSSAFEKVVNGLEEGLSVDIQAISERYDVNQEDLLVLYNMHKGESDEEEEGE